MDHIWGVKVKNMHFDTKQLEVIWYNAFKKPLRVHVISTI